MKVIAYVVAGNMPPFYSYEKLTQILFVTILIKQGPVNYPRHNIDGFKNEKITFIFLLAIYTVAVSMSFSI